MSKVRNLKQDAVLSQGGPRDVNFDMYRSLQQHRRVFIVIVLLKKLGIIELILFWIAVEAAGTS